jgi:peptide/nickel transport system substrate-binding protein
MKYRLFILMTALILALPAPARNFRWSSQGDASTLDPHAQNETFTNGINNLVYDYLVGYDTKLDLSPDLATSWKNTGPNTWIYTLRQGVKWQDGSAFTADDVVFSFERAKLSGTTFKLYSNEAGTVRKIDDYTIEFTTPVPNPIHPITLTNIFVMSKAWCEKNNVVKPQDFKNKEETFGSRNAMGTGPYRMVAFEPGVKTVLKKNDDWWGIRDKRYTGNVDTIEYRPIANQATRMAALRSGELDFVLDPPVQDITKMKSDGVLQVWEGSEHRVVMVGFDQARDELLYSDVKGKNPFKDRRVRLALYQAVDINALKSQVMRGLSVPTAIALAAGTGAGVPASMEKRYPYDPAASRRLLAEAGYPKGFGFTISCPNDRYVNDEKICVALAGMWAKVGLDVKVEAMPKSQYFPKAQRLETTAFLLGWGGATKDAMLTLKPVLHSRNDQGAGDGNYGNFSNARLDAAIESAEREMDMAKRQELINRAVAIVQDEVLVLPLHRQVIPWVSRKGVQVTHRANNLLLIYTVKMP